MMQQISNFFSKNRKFIPLWSTALLALAAYGIGAYFFVGMRNPQVFFNLFRNSSYLLISAIGMTFVILTGGIDLSVSGVVASDDCLLRRIASRRMESPGALFCSCWPWE